MPARNRERTVVFCLFFAVLLVCTPVASLSQQQPAGEDRPEEPVPYEEEEFEEWTAKLRRVDVEAALGFIRLETHPDPVKLRRAEVVGIGMFPLAFLTSRLGYDLIRFIVQSARAGEVQSEYAPWFFSPAGAPQLTTRERRGIIVASLGISGAVSLLDYLLGKASEQE